MEDDPSDAELVKIALDRAGWPEPVWVQSVATAIAPLEAEVFDLLLMDLSLPDGQGLATLQALLPHAERAGLPCVVMTGLNDEVMGVRAIELGAQDFIVKGEPSPAVLRRALVYSVERGQRARDLKVAKEEADKLASRCALTGLANRRTFEDRLGHAIERATRSRGCLALLYIDLDGFKQINDLKGHSVGDEVLRVVASRIAARVRRSDTVARLGGDEFAVILETLRDRELAHSIGEQIGELVSQPIDIAEEEVRMTASLGISVFPEDGSEANQLVDIADQRMYAQKRQSTTTS